MKLINLVGLVFTLSVSLTAAAQNSFSTYCQDLNSKSLNSEYQGKIGQLYGCWSVKMPYGSEDRIAMIFDFSSSNKNKNVQLCGIISGFEITPNYASQEFPVPATELLPSSFSFKDPNTFTVKDKESVVTYTRDLDGSVATGLYNDPSQKCRELEANP